MELPTDLREALDAVLAGAPARDTAESAQRLIERYRAGGAAAEPILVSRVDVLAYAAYRMPATYAAVRSALTQLALARPHFAPRRYLDLGGGTGAAAWAAVRAFPGLESVTVVDQAAAALAIGRRLAAGSGHAALRTAVWREDRGQAAPVPPSDLVTISYVLGELPDADRAGLVARAAAAAEGLLVVEPGTPAGYVRVLAARDVLLAAGLTVVAPCPHQGVCPLAGTDWCHFAARVNRSGLHRRLKNAELSYEDEKFSYVVGVRTVGGPAPAGRVLRHPVRRKGLVSLRVCTVDQGVEAQVVSKRQGARYRAARDVSWGDPWPRA